MDPLTPPPWPGGLPDPQPIFGWVLPWQAVLGALVLLAMLAALLRALTRRAPAAPVRRTTARPPPFDPDRGLRGAIRALEERVLAEQDYRRGLHELAALVHTHLEQALGVEVEALTATEATQVVKGTDADAWLIRVRDASYGRKEPSRASFHDACKDARRLFARNRDGADG